MPLRHEARAPVEEIGPGTGGERGQQLRRIIRWRKDLVLNLDAGILLLEFGDDLLVDGEPRRVQVHPHLERERRCLHVRSRQTRSHSRYPRGAASEPPARHHTLPACHR